MNSNRNIVKFKAATGFTVVLEFGGTDALEKVEGKIVAAGLKCERLPDFNPRFDRADLYMDMRDPACAAQFDLDDWL